MREAHLKTNFLTFLSAFLLYTVFCSSAFAAGQLDTTFNGTGKIQVSVGSFTQVTDVAVQPDGKIVAVGTAVFPVTFGDFLVLRYNPDGTPDTSFGGGDGIVTTVFDNFGDVAQAVAIQPDGKILVAGLVETKPAYQMGLARYNSDGSLDTSFDGDGLVTTLINNECYLSDMAVQYDGKIVVVGSTFTTTPVVAIVRYAENGALDTSFDADGIVTMSFQQGTDDRANAVAVQNDGKIVVGGYSSVWHPLHRPEGGVESSFALVRFRRDGKVDESFGNNGIVLTSVGGFEDMLFDLAVKENGKIIAAGASTGTNGGNCISCIGIVQYDQAGNLDPGFDTDGRVITNSAIVARKMSIQPDGKPVIVSNRSNDLAAVRTRANGILDDLFGLSGLTTVDFGGADMGSAITLQPDGKVIIAGSLIFGTSPPFQRAIGIARLTGDSPVPLTAGINGQAVDEEGSPLGASRVTVRNLQTGEIRNVTTNPFGYFGLDALPANYFYEITAQKKGRRFPGKQILRLIGNVNGLAIVGQ